MRGDDTGNVEENSYGIKRKSRMEETLERELLQCKYQLSKMSKVGHTNPHIESEVLRHAKDQFFPVVKFITDDGTADKLIAKMMKEMNVDLDKQSHWKCTYGSKIVYAINQKRNAVWQELKKRLNSKYIHPLWSSSIYHLSFR